MFGEMPIANTVMKDSNARSLSPGHTPIKHRMRLLQRFYIWDANTTWDPLGSCGTWHAIIRCVYRMPRYTEYWKGTVLIDYQGVRGAEKSTLNATTNKFLATTFRWMLSFCYSKERTAKSSNAINIPRLMMRHGSGPWRFIHATPRKMRFICRLCHQQVSIPYTADQNGSWSWIPGSVPMACRRQEHSALLYQTALASAQRQSRTISSIRSGGVLPVTDVQNDVDLEKRLYEWEQFYNFARPHGAHKGKTPYESLRDKLAWKWSVQQVRIYCKCVGLLMVDTPQHSHPRGQGGWSGFLKR